MDRHKLQIILGYILLAPAILSVLLFFYDLLTKQRLQLFNNLHIDWAGSYSGDGGYSSSLPLYFGLLAIAGAYLIAKTK